VLALPELAMKVAERPGQSQKDGKGHGRAQIEATRNGARPCPFSDAYNSPEARKRAIGSVTCIG
jgi:hypothetical protein